MNRLIATGAALAAAAIAAAPLTARQDMALKDLMPKGMAIGVAINQRQSDGVDAAAVDIITKQFNQISPENLLKFQSVHPAADRYVFEAQDRYVQFGVDRKMQIVGHNLVWHQQTSAWVFQGTDGKPADREMLLARMRDHIHTVVGRYKGRIHGWDVVNEAIDEDGSLRKAPWHDGIGDDYVAKAFEFAHEADPDAELYYNDYNLEKPAKRAGVIRLVKDLKARGLRIDGIGNQGHWRLEYADDRRDRGRARRPAQHRPQRDVHRARHQPAAAGRSQRRSGGRESLRQRTARREAATARRALRRYLRRFPPASRPRDPRHLLGPERRRFVAQSGQDELSAALGPAAPAKACVSGGRGRAEASEIERRDAAALTLSGRCACGIAATPERSRPR